jgi:hypothetical protein
LALTEVGLGDSGRFNRDFGELVGAVYAAQRKDKTKTGLAVDSFEKS